MKKALFALSLLVVAPMTAEDSSTENTTTPVVEVAAPVVETAVSAVETAAPKVEAIIPPVASEVKQNVFAKGYNFVKNGVTYSVVSVKDGIVCGYDKVTGTVERFTPQMILNGRDSVRNLIASYPLTAVALTAFVTVKAAEYFSAPAEAEENEDDSF